MTVLNGHIHQTMQKGRRQRDFPYRDVNGVSSTAPGKAESPGPMKVPAEQLRSVLGITDVNYVQGQARARSD